MIKSKLSFAVTVLAVSLVLALGLVLGLGRGGSAHIASASGLIDDALTDFELGSGCFVAQAGTTGFDGGVVLSPTEGVNFTSTELPSGWFTASVTFSPNVEIAGGVIAVDNAKSGPLLGADPANFYTTPRVLEFVATFTSTHDQHIGLAQNLSLDLPFGIFSTWGTSGQFYARTYTPTGTYTYTELSSSYLGSPHHYRIEWSASGMTYLVDGAVVASHPVALTGIRLRPQIFDSNEAGDVLTVDWLRMSDYAPSPCTFTSRVIDSGLNGSTFTGLSTTLATPAGTSIAFDVITSTDGVNWGTWTAINLDGTFSVGAARYLQYRATLSTSDPLVTPEVQTVQVHGFGPPPTAVSVAAFSAHAADSGERELLGLGGLLLLVGVPSMMRRRRIRR